MDGRRWIGDEMERYEMSRRVIRGGEEDNHCLVLLVCNGIERASILEGDRDGRDHCRFLRLPLREQV